MKLSRASIGMAIRAAREAAKMSLGDMAGLVGMTPASLSRTETGLRDAEFAEVVAIAERLGIELEVLRTLAETFEHSGAAAKARQKDQLKDELIELQRAAVEAAIEEMSR